MSNDMMIVPATRDDLDEIVAMTSSTRQQLASWAPVYFNPAEAADELHAGFMGFIIDSPDHTTRAVVSNGRIVGFFVEVPQSTLTWVDDLCIDDEAAWPEVIGAVAAADDLELLGQVARRHRLSASGCCGVGWATLRSGSAGSARVQGG